MANFTLVDLLRYPPHDAFLIACNETQGISLNPRFVSAEVVASTGADALVRLTTRMDNPGDENVTSVGIGEITVTRLDIAELLGNEVTIPYSGEIVSHDIARIITEKTGIVFDDRDFVTGVITPDNNLLVTASTSLRWHGQLLILQE